MPALRVLSGSRVLSCGLGNAGLFHFFLDAGECRFVRFGRGFLYVSHVYSPIVRGSSSYSSRADHDIDGEGTCLLHSAQMSVQLRPGVLKGLLAG